MCYFLKHCSFYLIISFVLNVVQAYCTILYLKPRMQIIIRGQNVKSQLISKSLAHRRRDSYKPSCLVILRQQLFSDVPLYLFF